MNNKTIANKVKAAGKEGRSYKTYRIDDVERTVILGEPTHWFWNQLIR